MIRKNEIVFSIVLLSVLMLSSVIGKSYVMQKMKSGSWGGQGISITVEDDAATIEYDCATGKISGPLKVDTNGRFALNGTHVREHGGPIREGERSEVPASYTGWTDGKKMTLRVTATDSKEVIGDYELEYGRAGRVRKCK
jgi:hypothetical protein